MTGHRELAPRGTAPPAANYSLAVATDGATRWVHTSGIVPIRHDGTVPTDVRAQAAAIWDTIGLLLDEADMDARNVVSVTTYAVPDQDLTAVMAERDRFMGDHRAASTLVIVAGLARPDWLVEISVIAAA